ncbi:hypothetical protein D4Q85_00305 [bacterium]|nr:MAG: hypothetical protein D4Q85_00305 [bacterium]
MTQCPHIAQAEVARLRAKGIEPTLDELACLFHWADRAEHPAGRLSPLLAGSPLEIGGRLLWPLTLQAEQWLQWASDWIRADDMPVAVCYAAEHGRIVGHFDTLLRPNVAQSAITEWAAGCSVTRAEVEEAASSLMPSSEPLDAMTATDDAPRVDMADIYADLFGATGQPPEWWQTRTSAELMRQIRAVQRDRTEALGLGRAEQDQANHNMRQVLAVVAAIEERHAKEHNGDE